MVQISNTAIIATVLILTGILTLVISYIVHKDNLAQGFKGGFWTGFALIMLGTIIVAFIAYKCSCNSSNEMNTGEVQVPVE